jgi:molybdopterin molybdotransferase
MRIACPGGTGAAAVVAAAAGLGELPVHSRLRVGVLSTGDEIVPAGQDGPGIPDANRPMLLAMVAGWGMEAVDLGHVGDDRDALRAVLDGAAADAILTTGGASAGDEDHVAALIRAEGTVRCWRVAVKPGRPIMLGAWGGRALIGLPGNPVAAFTCAALFARPALLAMAGAGWSEPEGRLVPAAFAKRTRPGRTDILRARLRDGKAEIFASEGSGRVSGIAWAEGFVILDDAGVDVAGGDPVRYVTFGELGVG